MTDNDLRDEVERLRHQVAGLAETVAALAMLVTGGPRPSVFPYDEMNTYLSALASEPHAFLQGPTAGTHPPTREGAATHGLTPPRSPVDVLPRGGRNVRIGCEHYESSGTWIHGRPHDCPKWARR